MFYDIEKNILYDTDTGTEIPIIEDGEYPEDIKKQIQLKKDHDYALSLNNSNHTNDNNGRREKGGKGRGKGGVGIGTGLIGLEIEEAEEDYHYHNHHNNNNLPISSSKYILDSHSHNDYYSRGGGSSHHYDNIPVNGEMKMQQELLQLRMNEEPDLPLNIEGNEHAGGWMDDFTLARALQAMEFEIAGETLDRGDFDEKEYRASSCKRQLLTISTLILLTQIGLLIAMVQDDGYAPRAENPLMGPPATTMVRYGAKDAALILYRHEWWRLITPIFLHAGILHLLSNGFIQLRIGGYLNRVFGTLPWLFIYFASGIYGNMLSCIFLPDAIGVGSSGALMGILSAWLIWIIFRWKKIPEECKSQRNCQMLMVTAAIALTLAFSFSKYVDWGAHFGGTIQGILSGILVLTRELDNIYTKWSLRILSFILFGISFGWALYTMLNNLEPSKDNFPTYEENDDWGH